MALVATDKGSGDFQIAPEGTYLARCFKMIDMGTQTINSQYGTKEQHKVMVAWELLDDDVKMDDGRPFSVTQFYNVSLHEKSKLRKDLEAWRGQKFTNEELEGFDLSNVVDTYCMIQVIHDDTGKYANVQAIMKAPKGIKPDGINDIVVFDIDNPDMETFDRLSDNMRTKIMAAPEWKSDNTKPEPEKSVPKKITKPKDDIVIEDIGDEPINLDEIPF